MTPCPEESLNDALEDLADARRKLRSLLERRESATTPAARDALRPALTAARQTFGTIQGRVCDLAEAVYPARTDPS